MNERRTEEQAANVVERFATSATRWTGSTTAFCLAVGTIIVWLITGPMFRWADTWQLVINTGTTIITFIMVFLIQRTQNKDSMAVQLKLNEIVAAIEGASNRLIDIEDLSEAELTVLHAHYQRLSQMAAKDDRITDSHSVEEADARHEYKQERRKHRRVK